MEPPVVEKTKGTLTVVFGRFNPPTTGHGKLLEVVSKVSENGNYLIVPSRTKDDKSNPLEINLKVSYMKKMFPKHKDKIINNTNLKTIFDVLVKTHNEGYSNVRVVVGSDRVEEFDNLIKKYDKKLYDFNSIEIISAGNRDPDGEGVEGVSASKQRQAVLENDYDTFEKGIPNEMEDKDIKNLFDDLKNNIMKS